MLCINCCKLKIGDMQIMLEWISYFIKPSFISDKLSYAIIALKMKR